MKRILTIFLTAICLNICHVANAQNDVYLVPNPQTAKWSYIQTDDKGTHISTIYYSVESLEGDGLNGKMKLLVEEVPVKSPKETNKSYDFYCFKDGELMVDLYSGFDEMMFDGLLDSLILKTIADNHPDLPEAKIKEVLEATRAELVKVSGGPRGIPRHPEVGKLPDYEFHVKFSIASMKVFGQERRIVGRESIQTKAGVFDCYILEEKITTKAMMMKEVEKSKSWYAYGIGLVKEITYDKNGKLISTMILNEIK